MAKWEIHSCGFKWRPPTLLNSLSVFICDYVSVLRVFNLPCAVSISVSVAVAPAFALALALARTLKYNPTHWIERIAHSGRARDIATFAHSLSRSKAQAENGQIIMLAKIELQPTILACNNYRCFQLKPLFARDKLNTNRFSVWSHASKTVLVFAD